MLPLSIPFGRQTVVIRATKVEEIVPLRHRVLRAGLPIEEARFEFDDAPTTCHVAAFEDSRAVCCATFQLSAWENQPSFQLRGMATDADWQRRGLGQAVLKYAMELVSEDSPVRLFWCNARVPALEFYRRQGWVEQSEEFLIPTAGPHRKMTRRA